VVAFGSRKEVPDRLENLLRKHLQLHSLPMIITGNDSEAEALRQVALNCGVEPDKMYVDRTAKDTEDNARFTVETLSDVGAKGKPILFVAFPVLAKSGIDALVGNGVARAGLPREQIIAAFPSSAIDPNDDSIKDAWVDAKMNAAEAGSWAGKGKPGRPPVSQQAQV